jgi:hypothetical protein
MKNPCLDCLVGMCCTEICPEKQNYDTLIRDALRHHENNGPRNSGRYHNSILRYSDHFRTYITKQIDYEKTNNKILTRKRNFKEGK